MIYYILFCVENNAKIQECKNNPVIDNGLLLLLLSSWSLLL